MSSNATSTSFLTPASCAMRAAPRVPKVPSVVVKTPALHGNVLDSSRPERHPGGHSQLDKSGRVGSLRPEADRVLTLQEA